MVQKATRQWVMGIVVVLMSVLCGVAVGAEETIRVDEDIVLRRVATDAWVHTTYADIPEFGRCPANGLVVVDGNEAMLVDLPWTDAQTGRLLDWIAQYWEAQVTTVVPTHWHTDCMGGLAEAHRRGAVSYALDKTITLARQKQLPVPQHAFKDKLSLRCGEMPVVLKYFGAGHTTDNIVAWLPHRQMLFGGCLIKSLGSKSLGNTKDADLDAYPVTLQKVRTAYPKVKVVVPGHGPCGSVDLIDHTLSLCPSEKK